MFVADRQLFVRLCLIQISAYISSPSQAGIQYTIYERESQYDFYNRPRDWGMLLHWGQEYLEKLLPAHLVTRLKGIRCDPELVEEEASLRGVPYVDAFTGHVIAEIPMQGVNRVSRMKLRHFLTDGQDLNIKASSSDGTDTGRLKFF